MNASSDKEAEASFHFVTDNLHSRDEFALFSLVNFMLIFIKPEHLVHFRVLMRA
jgi:hypothetical protein